MNSPIKVVVVDDNACMVWGLKHFIDSQNRCVRVVGAVSRRGEILPILRQHTPDIVLLEIRLDGQSGVELVSLVKEGCAARIIIFTDVRDPVLHEKAILNGAHGLVLKSEPVEVVVRAIEAVHAGELWLKRDVTARIVNMMATAYKQFSKPLGDSQFTPSETRVIAAAVKYRGAPNKVIANVLNMRPNTFRNHLSSIYVKLGIHRRLDLVLYGIQHGAGEDEDGNLPVTAMHGMKSGPLGNAALIQAAGSPSDNALAAVQPSPDGARSNNALRMGALPQALLDAKATPVRGPVPHALSADPVAPTASVRLVRASLRSSSPRSATRR